MTNKIFKYDLRILDVQVIRLPKGSAILTVQMQYGVPKIWVLVDENEEEVDRTIEMFGTGYPIDMTNGRKYLGTVQELDGRLVWHIFERYVDKE